MNPISLDLESTDEAWTALAGAMWLLIWKFFLCLFIFLVADHSSLEKITYDWLSFCSGEKEEF